MAKKECILDIVMFLIGVVFVTEALRLGLGNVNRPKPGFLPFYTGAALVLVSASSLINKFLAAKKEKDEGRNRVAGGSFLNVIGVIGAMVVYVMVLPHLGYLTSTFFLLIFLFKAAGIRKWAFVAVAAFLAVSLSYIVFSSWLNLRFPRGFLGV